MATIGRIHDCQSGSPKHVGTSTRIVQRTNFLQIDVDTSHGEHLAKKLHEIGNRFGTANVEQVGSTSFQDRS